MNLQLHKPLAFFDLETTGISIGRDRIVEIAIVKLTPTGERLTKRKLINPEMPIPVEASAVHGITNDMVANAPTFKQVANEIKQFIDGCDMAGYNCNRFDVPMLIEEFGRVGIDWNPQQAKTIDVQRIFHIMEPRTLSAAYKFYCNKTLDNAHSAEADTVATLEVLEAQVERYPEIGNTIDSIWKIAGEPDLVDYARRFVMLNGIEVFNFGKHKGRSVADVLKQEPSYYDWMMAGDFPYNTKQKLTEILKRTYLKKG
ncbi:MAG: exonuclease domain-containing protein [Chitinophagaceae bacterium]